MPVEQLDAADLLDAEAIRVITERTAEASVRTAEIQRSARRALAAHDLEAEELRLRLRAARQAGARSD